MQLYKHLLKTVIIKHFRRWYAFLSSLCFLCLCGSVWQWFKVSSCTAFALHRIGLQKNMSYCTFQLRWIHKRLLKAPKYVHIVLVYSKKLQHLADTIKKNFRKALYLFADSKAKFKFNFSEIKHNNRDTRFPTIAKTGKTGHFTLKTYVWTQPIMIQLWI